MNVTQRVMPAQGKLANASQATASPAKITPERAIVHHWSEDKGERHGRGFNGRIEEVLQSHHCQTGE